MCTVVCDAVFFSVEARRFLYFENVKAILGKKQSMRSLFNYIVQAWF